MFYTILKQWKTLDGQYHSATVDKSNYDSAFGEIHSMVKPMQNDSNVERFTLMLLDEMGIQIEKPIKWFRPSPVAEPTEPIE